MDKSTEFTNGNEEGITKSFQKMVKYETNARKKKERISLYVSEEIKSNWQDFAKENNYSTLSKLIRESVKQLIKDYKDQNKDLTNLSPQRISKISHALKEPLTSIKGYAQLLLEDEKFKQKLSGHLNETVKNIFDQSLILENKIISFLDNIKVQTEDYDILLIEDDLATIRLMTNYFKNKGYICKGVASGSKGLEELKNGNPKLILLDIILPDLSGYDICTVLKSDNEFKHIPIFFFTAISMAEVEKHIEETKVDGYILKPFNLSDFDFLFDLLEKKRKNS